MNVEFIRSYQTQLLICLILYIFSLISALVFWEQYTDSALYTLTNIAVSILCCVLVYVMPKKTKTNSYPLNGVAVAFMMTFFLNFIYLIFRSLQDASKKISLLALFRNLISLVIDITITIALFNITEVDPDSYVAVLVMGLINIGTMLSFTQMIRDKYVFVEDESTATALTPTIVITSWLTMTILAISNQPTLGSKLIKWCVVTLGMILLTVGAVTRWDHPCPTSPCLENADDSGKPVLYVVTALSLIIVILYVVISGEMANRRNLKDLIEGISSGSGNENKTILRAKLP